jgi:indolepyruvate ferredoxin oxidoreductase
VALQLLGDSIYTNPLMLGYAWQRGQIPLSRAALLRAIELNGVQVEKNRAAFEWGRRCAHDLAGVQSLFSAQQVIQIVKRPSLDELVSRRVEFLTGYQNAAYAAQYRDFVQTVRDAEQRVLAGGSGSTQLKLSEAVARYLFKLMAYKDEYEVARLHSDAAFHARLAEMFEGDFKIVHHLAPPKIATTDREGHLVKRRFGPWLNRALPWLAKLKALRGTALDPFGGTAERRTERALIAEYRATVEELLAGLSLDQLAQAVEIARLSEDIRGYGHVKERHLAAVRQRWGGLLAAWRSASRPSQAR